MLVRCSDEGSYDPLLRRPLFVAAADAALGQVALLYQAYERGLRWLSHGRPGQTLDIIGPLGQPFALDRRTRTLLLIGEGPGLAALLLLARRAADQGCAVTLLAGAPAPAALPPPYLLPADVEYQTIAGPVTDLLVGERPLMQPQADTETKRRRETKPAEPGHAPADPIRWADQVCAALPPAQLPALSDAVRAARLRWDRGYAGVLVDGPLVCGVGACSVCALTTRRGVRLLCSDGPVFDLREL